MKPKNEFLDHLLKLGIYPDEEVIDDGKYHYLTDAGTGRKYEYCIFTGRTHDLHCIFKNHLFDLNFLPSLESA